jgi:transcriptional regulator with XRE-family HTH domain
VTHPFGELSAQRQRLGAALRRLRVDAGLSAQQLAERAGLSQSRVSRIELGQQAVPLDVAERWAKAAGASGAALAEVMDLAESAATQAVAMRKSAALVKLQQDAREAEASAATILNFSPLGIPGLLQVPEYARRVFAAGYPRREAREIAAATAARMDRQLILYDEARHLDFVMTAAALYWHPGPASIMRAQLDRVSTVAALGNVTVAVIPLGAEVDVWCPHGFSIFDDRAGAAEPFAHVETMTSTLTLTEPEDIASYKDAFARLRDAAVTGDAAQRLIFEAASIL